MLSRSPGDNFKMGGTHRCLNWGLSPAVSPPLIIDTPISQSFPLCGCCPPLCGHQSFNEARQPFVTFCPLRFPSGCPGFLWPFPSDFLPAFSPPPSVELDEGLMSPSKPGADQSFYQPSEPPQRQPLQGRDRPQRHPCLQEPPRQAISRELVRSSGIR